MEFYEEAERCRHQALAYVGQPEADFLLKAASAFEDLAREHPGLDSLEQPQSPVNAR